MGPARRLFVTSVCMIHLLILSGCASTTIKSLSEPPPRSGFSRVYILTGHQGIDTTTAAKIVEGMKSEFNRRLASLGITIGGQSIVRARSDSTLADSTEIDHDAIRQFEPNGLLSIELLPLNESSQQKFVYAVEFTAVSSAKIIWRGQVSNSGYGHLGSGWQEMGEKTAREIVDRLLEDKILRKRKPSVTAPAG